MDFLKILFVEGILVLAAGLTFFGGIRGIALSSMLISILNAIQPWDGVWLRETILLAIAVVGALLLLWVNHQAGAHGVVNGAVGSLLSLVIFAVFMTPIAALVAWVIVLGVGLIPHMGRKQLFWSFAPTVMRVIVSVTWIIFGNIVVL